MTRNNYSTASASAEVGKTMECDLGENERLGLIAQLLRDVLAVVVDVSNLAGNGDSLAVLGASVAVEVERILGLNRGQQTFTYTRFLPHAAVHEIGADHHTGPSLTGLAVNHGNISKESAQTSHVWCATSRPQSSTCAHPRRRAAS